MYTYIHIYQYMYTQIYMYIQLCKHIHTYIYVYINIHIYIHVYIGMYKCVYIFLSVCGALKYTLYVRVNKSVGAHACVRTKKTRHALNARHRIAACNAGSMRANPCLTPPFPCRAYATAVCMGRTCERGLVLPRRMQTSQG